MAESTNPHATAPGTDTAVGRLARPSPQDSASAHWFALRVRSRQEFVVRDALDAQEIEQFCPTWRETVCWSDREKTTTRPVFTGYIFARFVPDAAMRDAVLQSRGVVSILSLDQKPAPIPDEVIAALRIFAATCKPATLVPYVCGVRVRVKQGPFAGVTGVVSRVKGATVLSIPVAILGRAVSVQIDAADVEEAPENDDSKIHDGRPHGPHAEDGRARRAETEGREGSRRVAAPEPPPAF